MPGIKQTINTWNRPEMHPPGFKDRRYSFRHEADMPVDLLLKDGTVLKVKACNLSLDGLLFSCDDWASKKIESRGIQNHPLDHIQISVTAELGQYKNLQANCSIITARRISQDHYQIGLEFIDFQNNSDANLLAYINSLNE